MSKKLGKLKTFELLDTLNWEFIREYIILNQSIEEKDEEIKLILDCIKKDARIAELEKQLEEAIERLAEYEDTGLTPQGIIELRDDATELFNENKELKAITKQMEK